MDGKRYYRNYFAIFFDWQRRYNRLDCFRMVILEELGFFFFDVEDPARNRNYVWNGVKYWKTKCVDCEEKEVKIHIRHSYVASFSKAYLGPT